VPLAQPLPHGIKPIPHLFQEAGYGTGCIGKWHLGAAEPFHPNKRGFDDFSYPTSA